MLTTSIPGWTFSEDLGTDLEHFKTCGNGASWFGWHHDQPLTMSTTLYGTGCAMISIENCFKGQVAVVLDGQKLVEIGHHSPETKIFFEYHDESLLEITESGMAIVRFNYFNMTDCKGKSYPPVVIVTHMVSITRTTMQGCLE